MDPEDWLYVKFLGWSELDPQGNEVMAAVGVLQIPVGYCVFRLGRDLDMLSWGRGRMDCIEFAVDWARKEISAAEIAQYDEDAT